MAASSAPDQGRVITSTPAKPTATAASLCRPGHSPSTGPASRAVISGAAKVMAVAWVSGSRRSAKKEVRVAATTRRPRPTCSAGLRLAPTRRAEPAGAQGPQTAATNRKLTA